MTPSLKQTILAMATAALSMSAAYDGEAGPTAEAIGPDAPHADVGADPSEADCGEGDCGEGDCGEGDCSDGDGSSATEKTTIV